MTKAIPTTRLDDASVNAFARRLAAARRDHVAIDPLTSERSFSLQDAYRVQEALLRHLTDAGERIVGAKLGMVSEAMRKSVGLDEPNYGWLTDKMFLSDGVVAISDLIQPRVEPEIAFVLKQALRGPDVSREAVLAATAHVRPALEIVDSSFRDYRFEVADNTSDLSSAGRVALGAPFDRRACDLAAVEVTLAMDGRTIDRAQGSAAMGHPADAVAWLANTLSNHARALKPGDVIISGGLTKAYPLEPGQTALARFEVLGDVSVTLRDTAAGAIRSMSTACTRNRS